MSVHRAYIGNIPESCSENAIRDLLSKVGSIREVTMKNHFCFVDFKHRGELTDAINRYHRTRFMGNYISVEEARGVKRDGGYDDSRYSSSRGGGYNDRRSDYGAPSYSSSMRVPYHSTAKNSRKLAYRVIVMNLSADCSWDTLKDHMKKAGEVNYVSCNDVVANVGIVEYDRSKDIKQAVSMLDKTKFMGRVIRVFDPKEFLTSPDSDDKHSEGEAKSESGDRNGYASVDEYSNGGSSRSRSRRSKSRSVSKNSRSASPRRRSSKRNSSTEGERKNGHDTNGKLANGDNHDDHVVKAAKYSDDDEKRSQRSKERSRSPTPKSA